MAFKKMLALLAIGVCAAFAPVFAETEPSAGQESLEVPPPPNADDSAPATATNAEKNDQPAPETSDPGSPAQSPEESATGATDSGEAVEPFAEPPAHDEDARPLTGDEIYQKVLDNRFNSYQQDLRMESGDRTGNTDKVEMSVKYMSTRETSKRVLSNSIAKYHAPLDVRHMGYLVINKAKGVDDQFVYMPSTRRVRRINLRGESVVGTDFSLEDIIPREFEDATYVRLPNETVEGVECYVVEVTPHEETNSEYSKFIASIDKKTFVPIKNVYWDNKGVKMKELVTSPDSITRFEDVDKSGPRTVWVALHSRVDNLKLNTFTTLDIEKLEANPGLSKKHFSQRNLTAGR